MGLSNKKIASWNKKANVGSMNRRSFLARMCIVALAPVVCRAAKLISEQVPKPDEWHEILNPMFILVEPEKKRQISMRELNCTTIYGWRNKRTEEIRFSKSDGWEHDPNAGWISAKQLLRSVRHPKGSTVICLGGEPVCERSELELVDGELTVRTVRTGWA